MGVSKEETRAAAN
jgi:hypothetical protein